MSTPPGRPVSKLMIYTHIYILNFTKLCPEVVWGPRLHNTNIINVWGLRPNTLVTLSLRNLNPRTPFGHLNLLHCTWTRTTTSQGAFDVFVLFIIRALKYKLAVAGSGQSVCQLKTDMLET